VSRRNRNEKVREEQFKMKEVQQIFQLLNQSQWGNILYLNRKNYKFQLSAYIVEV
jgi:hypothetical protein